MKTPCSSGVNFTMPQASFGPRVANIFPRTRKSGWFMCDSSVASGIASARLRKSSAVMLLPFKQLEPRLSPDAIEQVLHTNLDGPVIEIGGIETVALGFH